MNLQQLAKMQPIYQEVKVINKKIVIDHVVVEILGFILQDQVLSLYALEYDDSLAWVAEREVQEVSAEKQNKRPQTNREILAKEGDIEYKLPFNSVKKLEIDGLVLQVSGGSSGRLGSHAMEELLLVNEFIRLGARPSKAIEYVEFAGMMLTKLRIEGEFNTIPVPDSFELISLTQADNFKNYPANRRLSLEINEDYPHVFKCGKGENHIEFYINKVYLMDFKAEMKEILEMLESQSELSPEQLKRAKVEMRKNAKELCPEGMRVPVVEYESRKASLQMYLTEYLDKPQLAAKGTAMGIVVGASKKTGKHDWPLRALALEVVPEDTKVIDVEILSYAMPVRDEKRSTH